MRRLHVEPLERRDLLSASAILPTVSADWFTVCADFTPVAYEQTDGGIQSIAASASGASAYSLSSDNSYDWMIQFTAEALDEIDTVAGTVELLQGDIDFDVLCGLGAVGQVLVRSTGTDFDAVETWFENNTSVEWFSANRLIQADIASIDAVCPDDPIFDSGGLWGLENSRDTDIDAAAAWEISTGSDSVVVAIVDTGVDYLHGDLRGNIWTNPGEIPGNGIDDDGNGFIDDVHGYDFHNNDGSPMDDNGHGTHCAGTIGAVANNGTGIAGINWDVSIMGLKFLNSSGTGWSYNAVRSYHYMTMMANHGTNVRVANNSWGGGGYDAAMYSALRAAEDAGILCVAAAGNDAVNNDRQTYYPCGYDLAGMISVAATNSYDRRAAFSNYGTNTVDIAAPGVGIWSTYRHSGGVDWYASMSGTSMAAPHVTGVAALCAAVAPDASVYELRNAVYEGADSLGSLQGVTVGGRRLNAYGALSSLKFDISGAFPDGGELVTEALERFQLDFSASVDTSSIQASDFRVNNTPADSWRLIDVNSVEFIFTTSPLTASGTYEMRVEAGAFSGGGRTNDAWSASFTFDRPPTFGSEFEDLTLSHSQDLVQVELGVTDADGDDVTLTATAYTSSRVAEAAYEFAEGRGLYEKWLGFGYNHRGRQEKYFADSSGNWYSILPDGRLYAWPGGFAEETLITMLSPAYWANPYRLFTASLPARRTLSEEVALSIDDGILTIDPDASYEGGFFVTVTADDGICKTAETFFVEVTNAAPEFTSELEDISFSHSLDSFEIDLGTADADGDAVTLTATAYTSSRVAEAAYEFAEGRGLYEKWLGFGYNHRGRQEKYFADSSGNWYAILPDGRLYAWPGGFSEETLITTLSPGYWANPYRLFTASLPARQTFTEAVALSIDDGILTIDPDASYEGGFFVTVTADDGIRKTAETFFVEVTNAAPEFTSALEDVSFSHSLDSFDIELDAADADGDSVTLTATAYTANRAAEEAYEFAEGRGLYEKWFGFGYNHRGRQEKYFADSSGNWYAILPDGRLYAWPGGFSEETLITTLSPAYWANPYRLFAASLPARRTFSEEVALSIDNGVLTIDPDASYEGGFFVTVTADDGISRTTENIFVEVTNAAPEFTAELDDVFFSNGQHSLDVELAVTDADGDAVALTATAYTSDRAAEAAYEFAEGRGLYEKWLGFGFNHRGRQEKYFADSSGTWYSILPDGRLYAWPGGFAEETLITTLSPAYWANPYLLFGAQQPVRTPLATPQAALTVQEGTLTINPGSGFSGQFMVLITASDSMNDTHKTFFVDIPDSDPADLPILEEDSSDEADLDQLQAIDKVFEELEANLFRLDSVEDTGGTHVPARSRVETRKKQ